MNYPANLPTCVSSTPCLSGEGAANVEPNERHVVDRSWIGHGSVQVNPPHHVHPSIDAAWRPGQGQGRIEENDGSTMESHHACRERSGRPLLLLLLGVGGRGDSYLLLVMDGCMVASFWDIQNYPHHRYYQDDLLTDRRGRGRTIVRAREFTVHGDQH
ncbi:hypothetical protein VTN02DRAFT_5710 [Thermoascus thermophilus]